MEGGGGTEEEGVGRRTGGATRCDRSETVFQRSQISGRMREFATSEPRSCILVWSSSHQKPIEFKAWMVEHRTGMGTDSPGERVRHSWGVSMGSGISKNFALPLGPPVRQKHWAHEAQIALLDASLLTHFLRTRTLPVRVPTQQHCSSSLNPRVLLISYPASFRLPELF